MAVRTGFVAAVFPAATPNRSERVPVTAWIGGELAGEKTVEPEP